MSKSGGDNLEVEVKFFVPELAAFRERLLGVGAALSKARTHEYNIRYDNIWDGLRRKGQLLRLRQDAGVRLTFKGAPPEGVESEARVREELEVSVGDFDTLAAILERIGFERRQLYEKYRETFILGDVEIVLDEMPFGNFVELEGPEPAIRAAADQLDLDWQQRILDNYLVLMARLQALHQLPFDDLTFANFDGLTFSMADVLFPE